MAVATSRKNAVFRLNRRLFRLDISELESEEHRTKALFLGDLPGCRGFAGL